MKEFILKKLRRYVLPFNSKVGNLSIHLASGLMGAGFTAYHYDTYQKELERFKEGEIKKNLLLLMITEHLRG